MNEEGQGLRPDAEIGEFRLIRKLGQGGMGEVWLAEQPSVRRRVALKILLADFGESPEFVERFRREAGNAARLRHSAIVSVFTAGEAGGTLYLAMDYIEGRALSEVITGMEGRGTPPTAREMGAAVRIGIHVARALQYAHDQGLLHRDVKPANILLDAEGSPYLADFGLSLHDSESRLTMTGRLLGTPAYMAPEQLIPDRGPIDARVDVYSLAATIYELVTLERLDIKAIVARLTTDPTPARERNPEVPRTLSDVLERGLSRDRDDRPRSAGEFGRLLEECWRAEFASLPPAAESLQEDLLTCIPASEAGGEIDVSTPLSLPTEDHAALRWMRRVPGGPVVVAILAALCGIGWLLCLKTLDDPPADLMLGSFPFAFAVYVAVAPGRRREIPGWLPWAGRAVAVTACVLLVAWKEDPKWKITGIDIFIGLLTVPAWLLFDRWVQRGRAAFLWGMVVPFAAATALSSAERTDPYWNAFWFATGYLALFMASSVLVMLPEFFLPDPRRRVILATVRAIAIGIPAAILYFATY